MFKKLSGFTLIELIVVMGIIAILAGAAIVAINPGARFAESRNTTRRANVEQLLSSIQQYSAKNGGLFPTQVTTATTAKCVGTDATCADLSAVLVPDYLNALPTDPGGAGLTKGTAANTQYTVLYNATTKQVTVAAPQAENETISFTQ